MRFLHFIKQHNTVRMTAYSFSQLTAFLIAHVSGRSADQTADTEFLHVFRHINSDQAALIIKQIFRQRFGQFRLAYTSGSKEEETADRPSLIRYAGSGAQNGVGNQLYRLFLADDAAVKFLRQAQELLAV